THPAARGRRVPQLPDVRGRRPAVPGAQSHAPARGELRPGRRRPLPRRPRPHGSRDAPDRPHRRPPAPRRGPDPGRGMSIRDGRREEGGERRAAPFLSPPSSLLSSRYAIVHSDCLAFLQGLPDQSVDAIVTDPAYSGMNRHMMFGNGRIVGRYQAPDNPAWFAEFHDDPATYRVFLAQCHRALRDDRHLYVMFDSYSLLSLGALVRELFAVKNVVVWDKV